MDIKDLLKEAANETRSRTRTLSPEQISDGSSFSVSQQLENGHTANINLSTAWLDKVKALTERSENKKVIPGTNQVVDVAPVPQQRPVQNNQPHNLSTRQTQQVLNEDEEDGEHLLNNNFSSMIDEYAKKAKTNMPSFATQKVKATMFEAEEKQNRGLQVDENEIRSIVASEMKRVIKDDLKSIVKDLVNQTMADMYSEQKIKEVFTGIIKKAKENKS
jgi:hypothetical protein